MLSKAQLDKLALWQQVNASLSAYNKLIKAFFNAEEALSVGGEKWSELGIHSRHVDRHRNLDETKKFLEQVTHSIDTNRYQILFSNQDIFPKQVLEIFDPPPLFFFQGNSDRLKEAQIAIVGSRKPTPHAQKITFDLAQYLAQSGYIITSGLAQGVDYQAHLGALTQMNGLFKGRTIGVMGTGIDVCYPKANRGLFSQIVQEGGCLISELLPDMLANKHTFPRRNRIVAGLSLGTIVTEATIKSGSLITARLTSEQGKQVFAIPSHIDNVNATGCHHLIREGATLIYHPDQVIEDLKYQQNRPVLLNKPTESIINQNSDSDYIDSSLEIFNNTHLPLPNIEVPDHLLNLLNKIDWSGVDIDALVESTNLNTQTILSQLMELELLDLIMQQGGRYVRV